MRRYRIFEHDEKVWKESHGWGILAVIDAILGPLNIGGRLGGELLMATDSRGKQRNRGGGRVRFEFPRSSVRKHGVVIGDITDLLKRYGIRTRGRTHDAKFFYFTVRESQANWAIVVLERWKAGQLGESWKEQAEDRKQAQRRPGLLDRLFGGA